MLGWEPGWRLLWRGEVDDEPVAQSRSMRWNETFPCVALGVWREGKKDWTEIQAHLSDGKTSPPIAAPSYRSKLVVTVFVESSIVVDPLGRWDLAKQRVVGGSPDLQHSPILPLPLLFERGNQLPIGRYDGREISRGVDLWQALGVKY